MCSSRKTIFNSFIDEQQQKEEGEAATGDGDVTVYLRLLLNHGQNMHHKASQLITLAEKVASLQTSSFVVLLVSLMRTGGKTVTLESYKSAAEGWLKHSAHRRRHHKDDGNNSGDHSGACEPHDNIISSCTELAAAFLISSMHISLSSSLTSVFSESVLPEMLSRIEAAAVIQNDTDLSSNERDSLMSEAACEAYCLSRILAAAERNSGYSSTSTRSSSWSQHVSASLAISLSERLVQASRTLLQDWATTNKDDNEPSTEIPEEKNGKSVTCRSTAQFLLQSAHEVAAKIARLQAMTRLVQECQNEAMGKDLPENLFKLVSLAFGGHQSSDRNADDPSLRDELALVLRNNQSLKYKPHIVIDTFHRFAAQALRAGRSSPQRTELRKEDTPTGDGRNALEYLATQLLPFLRSNGPPDAAIDILQMILGNINERVGGASPAESTFEDKCSAVTISALCAFFLSCTSQIPQQSGSVLFTNEADDVLVGGPIEFAKNVQRHIRTIFTSRTQKSTAEEPMSAGSTSSSSSSSHLLREERKSPGLAIPAFLETYFFSILDKAVKSACESSTATGSSAAGRRQQQEASITLLSDRHVAEYVRERVPVPFPEDEFRRKLFLVLNTSGVDHSGGPATTDQQQTKLFEQLLLSVPHLFLQRPAQRILDQVIRDSHSASSSSSSVATPTPQNVSPTLPAVESAAARERRNFILLMETAIQYQLPTSTARTKISSMMQLWNLVRDQRRCGKLTILEESRLQFLCVWYLGMYYFFSVWWRFFLTAATVLLATLRILGHSPESWYLSSSIGTSKNGGKDEFAAAGPMSPARAADDILGPELAQLILNDSQDQEMMIVVPCFSSRSNAATTGQVATASGSEPAALQRHRVLSAICALTASDSDSLSSAVVVGRVHSENAADWVREMAHMFRRISSASRVVYYTSNALSSSQAEKQLVLSTLAHREKRSRRRIVVFNVPEDVLVTNVLLDGLRATFGGVCTVVVVATHQQLLYCSAMGGDSQSAKAASSIVCLLPAEARLRQSNSKALQQRFRNDFYQTLSELQLDGVVQRIERDRIVLAQPRCGNAEATERCSVFANRYSEAAPLFEYVGVALGAPRRSSTNGDPNKENVFLSYLGQQDSLLDDFLSWRKSSATSSLSDKKVSDEEAPTKLWQKMKSILFGHQNAADRKTSIYPDLNEMSARITLLEDAARRTGAQMSPQGAQICSQSRPININDPFLHARRRFDEAYEKIGAAKLFH